MIEQITNDVIRLHTRTLNISLLTIYRSLQLIHNRRAILFL